MSSAMAAQSRRTPWLFLSPFLVVFAVFTAWPLGRSMVLSLNHSYGPSNSAFVGLGNYRAMIHDPVFWVALKNTTLYTLGSVFIQLPLALGLALALEVPGIKGTRLARVVLFSPSMVGVVFSAMIFGLLLESRTGLINVSLNRATSFLPEGSRWSIDFPWLTEHVLPGLILASLWMYVGFNMVYFSTALQNVRKDLLEAARVDGAGPVGRFVHVTIPAIRPVASFVTLLSVIGSFQLFELPYLILDVAGRPSEKGITLISYLYTNGFDLGDLGYASAIGWVVGVILIVATVVERRVARGEEEAAA